MELLHDLAIGFSVAIQPINLLYCFVGVFIGTLIGVSATAKPVPMCWSSSMAQPIPSTPSGSCAPSQIRKTT